MVRRLEARKLEALADPLGKLVEVERLVEHNAGTAVRVPADLALDRPQTSTTTTTFLPTQYSSIGSTFMPPSEMSWTSTV